MSEQRPTVSVRYYLNLEESQDGFALVTFGKKTFSRFLTPVISIAIILWGVYLGFSGVGRYYVALGAFFLIMQGVMRCLSFTCCVKLKMILVQIDPLLAFTKLITYKLALKQHW